jgi:prolyl-tRNA editing enzyme YbaK/EbsC (Cys-tRNA(Pro) deacylase)
MASGVGSRFETWAVEAGIGIEVRRFPQGTRTAGDAAAAIGCSVGQIVKSLVFTVDREPVIVLISGADRLDTGRLAAVAGGVVARADAQVVKDATGYSIGGVPPFGHARLLAVYCDRGLLGHQVVWAAAGRPDAVFPIPPARLVELSGAAVEDLAASC